MKKQLIGFYFLLLTSVAASVQAGAGSAVLTAYIQNGTVTNTSGPGVTMTEVFYTLGPAGDNVATWDGSVGGGTAEDLLSNPQFFQSVRWSGLNVAPGSTFNFSGIDIDLIETLDPLSVTGATLDETGESLRGAYIRATFSDGSTACAPQVQQAWSAQQDLALTVANFNSGACLSGAAPVDEPTQIPTLGEYGLMLLVLMLGWIGFRHRGVA